MNNEYIRKYHNNVQLISQNLLRTVKDWDNISFPFNNDTTLHIQKRISKFDAANKEVSVLIDANIDNIIAFATKINASIEQVKYYEFFEIIIEDILIKLNEVYSKLNLHNNKDKDFEAGLSELLMKYTTISEHAIHDHFTDADLTGDNLIEDLNYDVGIDNDEDDDNLELF